DLQQLRWGGGIGIAYNAQLVSDRATAMTVFDGLAVGPRAEGTWALTRMQYSQAVAQPTTSWNTRHLDSWPIERPDGDALHIDLRFRDGNLAELIWSEDLLPLSELLIASWARPGGGAFGLLLDRSEGTISNVSVNGRRVRFAAPRPSPAVNR